jgi:hypothetical protein
MLASVALSTLGVRVAKAAPKKQSDRLKKSTNLLAIFAKYGGFGGLVLFVFLTLFSMFGNLKPFFNKVTPDQTYHIIVIFMVLVFSFSVIALLCWVRIKQQESNSRKSRGSIILLIILIVAGLGAWASTSQIKKNIDKWLPNAQVVPVIQNKQFLADVEWKATVQLVNSARYSGSIKFKTDHTVDGIGHIFFSTKKAPLKCGGQFWGNWSYDKGTSVLTIQQLNWPITTMDFTPDGENAKMQFDPCGKPLRRLQGVFPSSESCTLVNARRCVGDRLTLDVATK